MPKHSPSSRRTSKSKRSLGGPKGATRSLPPTPIVPGSLPEEGVARAPPTGSPHAHAVCKVCGRIAEVVLTPADRQRLEELSLRRPAGWSAEEITLSMTGACRSCQQGRPS